MKYVEIGDYLIGLTEKTAKEAISAIMHAFPNLQQSDSPQVCRPKVLSPNKWIYVNPAAIPRNLFMEPRPTPPERNLCKLILEAFQFVDQNPHYSNPFEFYFPATPPYFSLASIDTYAQENGGDHPIEWFELALVFAQLLANGATWDSICVDESNLEYFILTKWKDGNFRFVGNSTIWYSPKPVFFVHHYILYLFSDVAGSVPGIVRYL